MLSSHNLNVLIVDDDAVCAAQVASLVRVLGSTPRIASKIDLATRLLPDVDVLLVDDAAFANQGAAVAGLSAESAPHVYRCITAGWARFNVVRCLADYVIAKP